jgi:hypothetical protein
MKRKGLQLRRGYPANWYTEIVPFILSRSGGKCERCGLKNGDTVWVYKKNGKKHWARSFENARRLGDALPERQVRVVCAVAHLDHDEHNGHVPMDRLQYLCPKCHLEVDFEDNLRRLKEKRPEIERRQKVRRIASGYPKKRANGQPAS